MRVSFMQLQSQGVRNITRQQSAVAETQLQLATGRKLQSPADDPAGSARLLRVQEQISATEQYQRNITLANGRLAHSEGTLDQTSEVMQRAIELTLQASNDTASADDRQAIALEMRELKKQLFDLANTRDGNGEYLFGGYKSKTQPFVYGVSGKVSYQGDQGQREVQIGPQRRATVSDSGFELFQAAGSGNGRFQVFADGANTGSGVIDAGSVIDGAAVTGQRYRIEFTAADSFDVINADSGAAVLSGQPYSSGQAIEFDGIQTAIGGAPAAGDRFTVAPSAKQDMFATLDDLINALEAPSATPAEQARQRQGLNNGLSNLNQGLSHLLESRARIGARVNGIDNQDQANAEFMIGMEQIRSDIDGLDYAEAASRLSEQLLVLQAAQQSFVKTQNLSLFNYLR